MKIGFDRGVRGRKTGVGLGGRGGHAHSHGSKHPARWGLGGVSQFF
jgi:hypothetical protein